MTICLLDFSKEKIDPAALETLLKLPEAAEMGKWRRAMFDGEIVNGTERRAARHNLLRAMQPPLAGVADMREQFLDFAQMVRTGARLGSTGKQITDVVNIGIGGSYLGPRLAVEALKPFADGPRIHFVSNVDPWNFNDVVDGLDPARTLFLCASKSFGTQETVLNPTRGDQLDDGAAGAGGDRLAFLRDHRPAGRRPQLRHRAAEHLSDLGLGRRPFFDLVGDGALRRDPGGAGRVRRVPQRRRQYGPAFRKRSAAAQSAAALGVDRGLAAEYPEISRLCAGAL